MAQAVAQMVQMKYGRGDELEADKWGVRLTALAGYDPAGHDRRDGRCSNAQAARARPSSSARTPSRPTAIAYIEQVIAEEFPEGVPDGLEK